MTEPRPRLLIVDDNDDERQMLCAALGACFEVVEAADGMDAYALACADRPAAIVLDIAMPILDGWEVLRKLRSNAATKSICLIEMRGLSLQVRRRLYSHVQILGFLRGAVELGLRRMPVHRRHTLLGHLFLRCLNPLG